MEGRIRLLIAVLIALGTIGINAAHPTHAAGTQVGNCNFATLQTDLQSGGISTTPQGSVSARSPRRA